MTRKIDQGSSVSGEAVAAASPGWWRRDIPRPHLRPDGIPTRNDQQWRTAAEDAISKAMLAVEEAGASVALTDAVTLLAKARDRVADHVEHKPEKTQDHSSKALGQ